MKRRHADTTGVSHREPGQKRVRYCPHPPGASSHSSGLNTAANRDYSDSDTSFPDCQPLPATDKILRLERLLCDDSVELKTRKARCEDYIRSMKGADHSMRLFALLHVTVILGEKSLARILERCEQANEAMKEKHRNEIASLHRNHDDAIATLKEQRRFVLAEVEKKSAATIAEKDAAHRKALSDARETHRAMQLEVEEARVECADLRKANAKLQSDYAASQTAEAHLRSEYARVLIENAKLYGQNTTFRLQRLGQRGSAEEDAIKVEDEDEA